MQAGIWYESLTERDYMYLLEIDSDVLSYSSQPLKIIYTLDNRQRHYTPDFLVERHRQKQIIEIKPARQLNSEKNTKLFQCIDPIIQEKGWEFLVITDEMIRQGSLLNNIKLLYRYALVPLNLQILMTAHQYFLNKPPIALKTAEEDLKSKGIFREVLLKLLFVGFLDTNLRLTIGDNSKIGLSLTETNGRFTL